MKTTRLLPLAALLALPGLAAALDVTYHVTQNVGSLSLGQPGIADPYLFLDFQLTDGTNTGNKTSTVAVSNLSLSGGTFDFADTTLPNLGNVAGGGRAFTLYDGPGGANATADHSVLFRVSSSTAVLSYDFTLTADTFDAPTPDGFSVAMLYRTGAGRYDLNVVPTLGLTGNELVGFTFDGGASTVPVASGVDPAFANARKALGDNRFSTLGAPTIAPVPEPSAIAALGLGIAGLARKRRKG